jgi:hypothetical protein
MAITAGSAFARSLLARFLNSGIVVARRQPMTRRRGASVRKAIGEEYCLRIVKPNDFRV